MGFAQVMWITENWLTDLSGSELKHALWWARYAKEETGVVWRKHSTAANALDCNIRYARKMTKTLEEKNILQVLPQYLKDGSRTANIYKFPVIRLKGEHMPWREVAGIEQREFEEQTVGQRAAHQKAVDEGEQIIPNGTVPAAIAQEAFQIPLIVSVDPDPPVSVDPDPPDRGVPNNNKRLLIRDSKSDKDTVRSNTFEVFWLAYPKDKRIRNPKEPARKIWEKLMQAGEKPEPIIGAVKEYAIYCADEENQWYKPAHARTWLNQRRWQDYGEQVSDRELCAYAAGWAIQAAVDGDSVWDKFNADEPYRKLIASIGKKRFVVEYIKPNWETATIQRIARTTLHDKLLTPEKGDAMLDELQKGLRLGKDNLLTRWWHKEKEKVD